jgi:hypothetical protein
LKQRTAEMARVTADTLADAERKRRRIEEMEAAQAIRLALRITLPPPTTTMATQTLTMTSVVATATAPTAAAGAAATNTTSTMVRAQSWTGESDVGRTIASATALLQRQGSHLAADDSANQRLSPSSSPSSSSRLSLHRRLSSSPSTLRPLQPLGDAESEDDDDDDDDDDKSDDDGDGEGVEREHESSADRRERLRRALRFRNDDDVDDNKFTGKTMKKVAGLNIAVDDDDDGGGGGGGSVKVLTGDVADMQLRVAVDSGLSMAELATKQGINLFTIIAAVVADAKAKVAAAPTSPLARGFDAARLVAHLNDMVGARVSKHNHDRAYIRQRRAFGTYSRLKGKQSMGTLTVEETTELAASLLTLQMSGRAQPPTPRSITTRMLSPRGVRAQASVRRFTLRNENGESLTRADAQEVLVAKAVLRIEALGDPASVSPRSKAAIGAFVPLLIKADGGGALTAADVRTIDAVVELTTRAAEERFDREGHAAAAAAAAAADSEDGNDVGGGGSSGGSPSLKPRVSRPNSRVQFHSRDSSIPEGLEPESDTDDGAGDGKGETKKAALTLPTVADFMRKYDPGYREGNAGEESTSSDSDDGGKYGRNEKRSSENASRSSSNGRGSDDSDRGDDRRRHRDRGNESDSDSDRGDQRRRRRRRGRGNESDSSSGSDSSEHRQRRRRSGRGSRSDSDSNSGDDRRRRRRRGFDTDQRRDNRNDRDRDRGRSDEGRTRRRDDDGDRRRGRRRSSGTRGDERDRGTGGGSKSRRSSVTKAKRRRSSLTKTKHRSSEPEFDPVPAAVMKQASRLNGKQRSKLIEKLGALNDAKVKFGSLTAAEQTERKQYIFYIRALVDLGGETSGGTVDALTRLLSPMEAEAALRAAAKRGPSQQRSVTSSAVSSSNNSRTRTGVVVDNSSSAVNAPSADELAAAQRTFERMKAKSQRGEVPTEAEKAVGRFALALISKSRETSARSSPQITVRSAGFVVDNNSGAVAAPSADELVAAQRTFERIKAKSQQGEVPTEAEKAEGRVAHAVISRSRKTSAAPSQSTSAAASRATSAQASKQPSRAPTPPMAVRSVDVSAEVTAARATLANMKAKATRGETLTDAEKVAGRDAYATISRSTSKRVSAATSKNVTPASTPTLPSGKLAAASSRLSTASPSRSPTPQVAAKITDEMVAARLTLSRMKAKATHGETLTDAEKAFGRAAHATLAAAKSSRPSSPAPLHSSTPLMAELAAARATLATMKTKAKRGETLTDAEKAAGRAAREMISRSASKTVSAATSKNVSAATSKNATPKVSPGTSRPSTASPSRPSTTPRRSSKSEAPSQAAVTAAKATYTRIKAKSERGEKITDEDKAAARAAHAVIGASLAKAKSAQSAVSTDAEPGNDSDSDGDNDKASAVGRRRPSVDVDDASSVNVEPVVPSIRRLSLTNESSSPKPSAAADATLKEPAATQRKSSMNQTSQKRTLQKRSSQKRSSQKRSSEKSLRAYAGTATAPLPRRQSSLSSSSSSSKASSRRSSKMKSSSDRRRLSKQPTMEQPPTDANPLLEIDDDTLTDGTLTPDEAGALFDFYNFNERSALDKHAMNMLASNVMVRVETLFSSHVLKVAPKASQKDIAKQFKREREFLVPGKTPADCLQLLRQRLEKKLDMKGERKISRVMFVSRINAAFKSIFKKDVVQG